MLRLRTIVALVLVGFAGAVVASVAVGGPLGVVDTTATDPPTTTDPAPTTTDPTPTTTDTTQTTTDPPPATTDPATTTEPAPTMTEATTTTPATTDTTTVPAETAPPPDTSTTPTTDPDEGSSAGVTIRPAASPGNLPPTGSRGPADVANVTARLGKGWVTIRWTKPDDPQFSRVSITRTPGRGGAAQTRVYSGSGTSFHDQGLAHGAEYRYLLTAVAKNGARSPGIEVIVEGEQRLLIRPEDGARLKRAPKLAWARVTLAKYYNVQLFLGHRKVLSAWPKHNWLKLPTRWKYGKQTHRLVSGRYTWYVWPGFGRLSDGKYGALLGASHFRFSRY